MNAVENDIKVLVQKELKSANEKFQLFSSVHEASAVLREEIEELEEETSIIRSEFNRVWQQVRQNSIKTQFGAAAIDDIKAYAINAAIEAIQVAAMCDKFQMSLSQAFEEGNDR